jgi:beta-lactamase regulating signal transducer with metallopeptidase domain
MTELLNSPFARDVGMTLVHSLWQVCLVAIAFAITIRLLAQRSANLRYLVAYIALVLTLAMPVMTLLVLSLDTSSSQGHFVESTKRFEDARSVTEPELPLDNSAAEASVLPGEPRSDRPVVTPEVADANGMEVETSSAEHAFNRILPWLALGWSVGVIAFSLRPFLALYRCHLLRIHARRLEVPRITDTVQSLCSQIGLKRTVEVASSSRVRIPMVLGFVRPIVLLPVSMVTGQTPCELSAIIAHELAHVRRHDFLLNLFQTAIETLLFYHPAVWWISCVVRREREHCCDDIAISIVGRKDYARALVNLESARSSATGLAMAVDGGSLYQRIHRIARPLDNPNPIGRWLAALVALAALLIGIAAILPTDGVATAAIDQSENESVESTDDKVNDDSAKDDKPLPANATRTYAGKVLNADGRPVAGVKVYAENTAYDRRLERQVSRELESTLSAADGSYSLTFKPQDGGNQVIAAKKGYGPAIVSFEELHELFKQGKSQLDLQFVGEIPITGRVVDTEGNPLGGVTVRVDEIALPKSDDAVADWIANERPKLFSRRDRNSMMMSNDARITKTAFPVAAVVRHGSAIPGEVTTAADGSFRLDGLGENCRVRLTLSGPNIAKRQAIVVTRKMENVVAYARGMRSRDFTHYGASPTLVASPTQPIVGRVVDAETEQPLPNMSVQLARIGKDAWGQGADEITDVTDADGRFRLVGAPLGGQHIVEVIPPLDQPYFETKRELPVASGSAPLECDFELPRTKWIRGRVTDEQGDPVAATLEFYPYRDNPHAEPFTIFDPQVAGRVPYEKFDSNENGYFRIKAIPGQAILAAVAQDRDEQSKYIPNHDDDLLERIGGQRMRKVYNGWSADYFDALVEVNLAPDEDELKQDLQFKLGRTRTLSVTDDTGQPVSEIQVIGRTSPPNHRVEPLEKSSLEVVGLQSTESRMVVLMHEQRELGKVLKVNGAELSPISVRLLTCASATGRVVDEKGVGIENISIRVAPIQEPKTDNWSRELNEATTDTDGEFRVLMPPGGAYRIFALSDVGPNFSATIRPQAGVTYELGDLKDETKLEESDTAKLPNPKGNSSSPH